jgi:2-dehydro-3-deoxy-D-arabinonate dehydratase
LTSKDRSTSVALWRIQTEGGPRFARGPLDSGPRELLDATLSLDGLLGPAGPSLAELAELPSPGPVPVGARLLAPLDRQPVWAAGVTFKRSREARKLESETGDFYDLVYDAERPELFLKALPGEVRGPEDAVGIRNDSSWDVPEPELGVVADHAGAAVAFLLGNDVSSRSIEGDNPLYLPQAKVYDGSCALGPCIVPLGEAPRFETIEVILEITRAGIQVFADRVLLADMRRTVSELLGWLFHAKRFDAGAILLTGTSIVPGPAFTLAAGDVIEISASGLGMLRNTVEVVGAERRVVSSPSAVDV